METSFILKGPLKKKKKKSTTLFGSMGECNLRFMRESEAYFLASVMQKELLFHPLDCYIGNFALGVHRVDFSLITVIL